MDLSNILSRIHRQLKKNENPRIAILGGKGLGKEELARLLLKKLIEEKIPVTLIDGDPNCQVFAPPGVVSIKTFWKETKVEDINSKFINMDAMELLGTYEVSQVPTSYRDAMTTFLKMHSNLKERSVLLLVTHSIVSGIGSLMTPSLLAEAKITFFLHLKHSEITDNTDLASLSVKYLQNLSPFNLRYFSKSAQDLYFKKMMRYFGVDSLKSLHALTPICVSLSALNVYRHHDAFLEHIQSPMTVCDMNMCMIAIGCGSPVRFLGFGIVVAIIPDSEVLCIVTPLEQRQLVDANANCIIFNNLENVLQVLVQENANVTAWDGSQSHFAFSSLVVQGLNTGPKRKSLPRLRLMNRSKEI